MPRVREVFFLSRQSSTPFYNLQASGCMIKMMRIFPGPPLSVAPRANTGRPSLTRQTSLDRRSGLHPGIASRRLFRLPGHTNSWKHRSKQSVRVSAEGPSSGGGRPSNIKVTELLYLIRGNNIKADGQEIEDFVNDLWSLQYAVPGACVCGSGGAIVSKQIPTQAAEELEKGGIDGCDEWSHVVHIRMNSLAAARSFCSHPSVEDALRNAKECCGGVDCIAWEAEVGNQLESVFRQGEGWDEGVEHLVIFYPNGRYNGNTAADMPAMLSQLSGIAESSRCGSVQSVQGTLDESISSTSSASRHVLMGRFLNAEQLDNFITSPPYQALWEGSERLPGKVALSLTFLIAPSDEQASTGISSGFLP